MSEGESTRTTAARPLVPRWLDAAAGWSWRGLVVAAAVVATLWLFARLSVVVLPLVIALILATLCVPPTHWLRDRGVPNPIATAIVVIGGLTGVIGVLAAIAPDFVDQVQELRPTVDQGIQTLLTQLDALGYDEERLGELLQQARETIASSSSSIVSGLVTGVSAAVSGVAGIALLVVLLFFIVKDGQDMTAWVLARTPADRREVTAAVGRRAWGALSGYVRGTAAIAAIDAIAIGVGLALLGVPLVRGLMVLVFLGGFLPVVGALLAGMIAVLVALADGGVQTGLFTLVLIVGVQQLEGNVLQPMIMRRAVALHPVVVLAALAIGATLAGIVGAFLSLPVAAVAAAVGNELRIRSEALGELTSPPEGGTA